MGYSNTPGVLLFRFLSSLATVFAMTNAHRATNAPICSSNAGCARPSRAMNAYRTRPSPPAPRAQCACAPPATPRPTRPAHDEGFEQFLLVKFGAWTSDSRGQVMRNRLIGTCINASYMSLPKCHDKNGIPGRSEWFEGED
jgi:hypothetical protein